jgi:acyl-CoA dehydrogenase
MALVLSDEQMMLRDNARGFLARSAPIAHLRQLRDERDPTGFSQSLWKQCAEMGWAGILVPAEHGGLGLGYVEAGVVMEELGRTLTPSPFLSTAVLAATALARAGASKYRAHLEKIARGELIAALAVDEGPKHRPDKIALSARRDGGGFTLNGAKTFAIDAHVADLIIVAARTAGRPGDAEGVTMFVVDAKTRGAAVERTIMTDSHNSARVELSNVSVGGEAVLGEVDAGFGLLEGVLNAGRAAAAAEMVGIGDEVFARTVNYLKERKQFGKAIGEFQALQHRAANLYCEIEVTRSAVLKALLALDESFDKAGPAVAVAKARAGISTTLAVQEGVQMHGGIGMTDELDMGLYMKRARVLQEIFGDANFHADRLARRAGY